MKKHLKKLAAVAALMMAAVFGPVGQAHASAGDGPLLNNSACLSSQFDSHLPEGYLHMDGCNGTPWQHWTLQWSGYYYGNPSAGPENVWIFRNGNWGCMNNAGWSSTTVAACDGRDSEKFIEVDSDSAVRSNQFALAPFNNPAYCIHSAAYSWVNASTCDNASSEWWYWWLG